MVFLISVYNLVAVTRYLMIFGSTITFPSLLFFWRYPKPCGLMERCRGSLGRTGKDSRPKCRENILALNHVSGNFMAFEEWEKSVSRDDRNGEDQFVDFC